MAVLVRPYAQRALLDGVEVASGAQRVVFTLAPGRAHRVEIEHACCEPFVRECLQQIDVALFGVNRPLPPLLVASNSDGIFKANNFLSNCPGLKKTIKAIYDFDGSFHVDAGGITLVVPGVHTFRYDGAHALRPGPRADKSLFLTTVMGAHPTRVPLPHDRWERHPFHTPASVKDINWLHHHIPSCMLHHGLQRTRSI